MHEMAKLFEHTSRLESLEVAPAPSFLSVPARGVVLWGPYLSSITCLCSSVSLAWRVRK